MKPTSTDLQLYLAGALPASKRLMMRWALWLDSDLRDSLRSLRELNAGFRDGEMQRLRRSLFPFAASRQDGRPGPARNGTGFPSGFRARRPALAGALALLVICALPWIRVPRSAAPGPDSAAPASLGGQAPADPGFVAKGRGLGISLFVKGDIAYRVENHAARLAATDTLQVVPLGSEPQQLVLLGWDARQGLVRLFPKSGGRSRRVSRLDPPPALLLQDMAENRLICVTAVSPFPIAAAEAALRGKPFLPMEKAPSSHLHKGLYLQVFAISKGGPRI